MNMPEDMERELFVVQVADLPSGEIYAASASDAAMQWLESEVELDPSKSARLREPGTLLEVMTPSGSLLLVADTDVILDEVDQARRSATQVVPAPVRTIPKLFTGNSVTGPLESSAEADAWLTVLVLGESPKWKGLDEKGATALLTKIERLIALDQGRPPANIEINGRVACEGAYERESHTIVIPSKPVYDSNIRPALRALWQQQRVCCQYFEFERTLSHEGISQDDTPNEMCHAPISISNAERSETGDFHRDAAEHSQSRVHAFDGALIECERFRQEMQKRVHQPGPMVRRRIHGLEQELKNGPEM